MKRLLAFLCSLFISLSAGATAYFVDGDNGSNSNNGLSWATAWKDPGLHGTTMNVAGNVQYIKASKYAYPNLFLQNLTGTASQHIQFIGVPGPRGARPLVSQSSSGQIGGAYWPANLHYVDVTNIDAYNPPSLNPQGACWFIGSTGGAATVDHITLGLPAPTDAGVLVAGFSAIGCGGEGIQAEYLDYLDVENGFVANNGSTITNASPSGISYLSFCALDAASGYHNIIRNNIVFGEASTTGSTVGSDYNGIIIDDMDNYQVGVCGHVVYLYKTLIQDNVVFGNQGKAIHIWASMAGADVDHNTTFMNCQLLNTPCSVNDADVDCLGASGHYTSNCNFTDNIIYAPYYALKVQGLDPTSGHGSADCNVEYGANGTKPFSWDSVPSGGFTNTRYVTTNPNLMNPLTALAGADFRKDPTLGPAMPAGC